MTHAYRYDTCCVQLEDERALAEDVLLGAVASHFNSAPSFSQEGQEVRFGVCHIFRIGSWRVGGVFFACTRILTYVVLFAFIIRSIMIAAYSYFVYNFQFIYFVAYSFAAAFSRSFLSFLLLLKYPLKYPSCSTPMRREG